MTEFHYCTSRKLKHARACSLDRCTGSQLALPVAFFGIGGSPLIYCAVLTDQWCASNHLTERDAVSSVFWLTIWKLLEMRDQQAPRPRALELLFHSKSTVHPNQKIDVMFVCNFKIAGYARSQSCQKTGGESLKMSDFYVLVRKRVVNPSLLNSIRAASRILRHRKLSQFTVFNTCFVWWQSFIYTQKSTTHKHYLFAPSNNNESSSRTKRRAWLAQLSFSEIKININILSQLLVFESSVWNGLVFS